MIDVEDDEEEEGKEPRGKKEEEEEDSDNASEDEGEEEEEEEDEEESQHTRAPEARPTNKWAVSDIESRHSVAQAPFQIPAALQPGGVRRQTYSGPIASKEARSEAKPSMSRMSRTGRVPKPQEAKRTHHEW